MGGHAFRRENAKEAVAAQSERTRRLKRSVERAAKPGKARRPKIRISGAK